MNLLGKMIKLQTYMHLTMEPQSTWKKNLTELKGEMDNSNKIVADFNTPLSKMDKTII